MRVSFPRKVIGIGAVEVSRQRPQKCFMVAMCTCGECFAPICAQVNRRSELSALSRHFRSRLFGFWLNRGECFAPWSELHDLWRWAQTFGSPEHRWVRSTLRMCLPLATMKHFVVTLWKPPISQNSSNFQSETTNLHYFSCWIQIWCQILCLRALSWTANQNHDFLW